MNKKYTNISMVMGLLALLLAGCGGAAQTGTPTQDPAAIYTAAAETANVRLTEMQAQTPTPAQETATPTPDVALTAAVQTVAVQLTQTAAFVITPTPAGTPTATAPVVVGGVDRAVFVQDVTVLDGTDFKPKETFSKTWRIQNSGTSTWTTQYAVVFVQGDKMGGPDSQRLTISVPAGTSIDITVSLTAPETPGRYTGWWKLMNASSQFFDEPFYVEIDVVASTAATATTAPSVTPGGPTATATATTASSTITNLSMAVDNASVTGACPQTFNFTGKFDVSTSALVTYQLEAGSSTPGVSFTLPAAQTVQMGPGTQTLPFNLTFTNSMEGWVRLRITAPMDVTSNQATFSLTCQP